MFWYDSKHFICRLCCYISNILFQTENDFSFAKDGSTGQKLDILERMMLIKKNVTMIGEFTDRGPKLFTEKAAGNICGCIGFVKDKNTKLNVPNTLLKKDIRDKWIAEDVSFLFNRTPVRCKKLYLWKATSYPCTDDKILFLSCNCLFTSFGKPIFHIVRVECN